MPKFVDPQARRDEVLAAAWRVIEREGIQGATIRAIAAEAGASTAVVTHYFRNKEDVLRSALDLSHSHIGERRERKLLGLSGLAALETALLQMLPLDAERRLELRIEVNFWARAISDEDSRAQHLLSHDRSLKLLSRLVAQAIELGEIDRDLDPRRVADGLLAFIDGVGVDAIMHPAGCRPSVSASYCTTSWPGWPPIPFRRTMRRSATSRADALLLAPGRPCPDSGVDGRPRWDSPRSRCRRQAAEGDHEQELPAPTGPGDHRPPAPARPAFLPPRSAHPLVITRWRRS